MLGVPNKVRGSRQVCWSTEARNGESGKCALNEAGEHLPGPNFQEAVTAECDERLKRLNPAHGRVNLRAQFRDDLVSRVEGLGGDVRDEGHGRGPKRRAGDCLGESAGGGLHVG